MSVLIIALSIAAAAAAQQGTTVSGTLTNSLSHEPLANATVRIEELGRDARSGADGKFSMTGVPAGAYHLLVRANGYTPHRSEITVRATPFTVDLGIDPELLKLFASYSFGNAKAANTITARLDNATNELYHNHLNYLKDLAPEVGRNFRLLYGVKF